MSPPFCLALLLLVASVRGVLAVDDIDQNIAAAVFGVLIVIFAIIGIIFLILIIRLRRKLRHRGSREEPDTAAVKNGIMRVNTDRGIVGYTKRPNSGLGALPEDSTYPSTLVPIEENAEYTEDVVPNYDSLSHTSAFYEKVNEPNPAYQQYRKQSESIPIGMMSPKHNTQTVENALYSDVSALLPDETEPNTISFMPSSEIKRYEDETMENTLYSTTDDTLYSSVDKEGKPVTTNQHKPAPPAGTIAEAEDKEPPIYAVPVKKNSRIVKPGQDAGEKSEKPTGQWVTPEVGSTQQDSGPDMSIFVSKSQTKLDSDDEAPDVPPFNDTDEVFDNMLNILDEELQPKRLGRLENRGSIMSTTSDDRDLLRPDVKLHDRPKISHPKPTIVSSVMSAAKAKFTPSPKVKRAHQPKSTAPSSQIESKAPATSQQQQTRVKHFSQPQQTSSKPPIGVKPKVDAQLLQASPKLKPSNSHLSAMASNQQGSGRASPNMQLHPNTSQGNPLQPLKDRSSPRAQRKGVSVNSALQDKPVTPFNQRISKQGKSQTQLTQSHPTGAQAQKANPLQPLVAKSSPRVKPKGSPAVQQGAAVSQTRTQQKKPEAQLRPTGTSAQHQASPLEQLRAKSSPRVKPKGIPAPQIKQVAPVGQVVSQHKKPEAQLHPTGAATQNQANPLQELRAKSSPRVKPREIPSLQNSASPSHVVRRQQAQSSHHPPATSSQQRLMSNPMSEAKTRSSIATEIPTQSASLGLNKPAEKQRPKSAVTVDEVDSKTGNITRNTGATMTFKDKRKQEEQDLDDTFKEIADFLTTI